MIDAEARRRAAQSDGENLVVVAGAGTGKTSLLVERVLHQLVRCGLGVEELVAITFTEKAAAEMRERVGEALERLADLARVPDERLALDPKIAADRAYAAIAEKLPRGEIAARASARLRDLPRAAISTIHAWCAGLLRAFPLEAGIDPEFAVDEGPRFEVLREELWHQWLGGPDRASGPRAGLWTRVLETLELGELQDIAFRLARFDLPEDLAAPDEVECALMLQAIAERELARIAELTGGARGPESWLAGARQALEALADGGLEAFRRVWHTADFQPATGPRKRLVDSAPGSKRERRAAELVEELDALFRKLDRADDAFARDVAALLRPIAAAVRERARLAGIVPFDALLRLTRDLLARRPEIRRELGARIKALLVDEFQDTDPLQYEIVFFLAESSNVAPARDPWDTALAPGKLFVVGDPKQAIYRFRGADLSAYHRATQHILASGGVSLSLTTNFRSPPELLEPLDPLFSKLLNPRADESDPEVLDACSGYERLVSGVPSAGEPRVEIWTVGTPGQRSSSVGVARRAEAEVIADWIARALARGEVAAKHVAVLFRALSEAPLYLRALEVRGVPCALDGGRDRLERPEARLLVALLRALANPADAPAVLAVLRSPLGGVPDSELARHAAEGGVWSYLSPPPEASDRATLARALTFLAEWRRELLRLPLDAFLLGLVERSPLAELTGLGPGGELRARNLFALVDELTSIARSDPSFDAAALLPWLETLTRSRDIGRARAVPNAVRLMSVHASKGLEFPVVIVPDLGRTRRDRGDPRVERVRLARSRSGLLALETRGPLSTGWVAHERTEDIHGHEEDKRLFYVACTRAMQRLVFVYAPRKRDGSERFVDYLEDWGYTDVGCAEGTALAHPGVVARQPALPEAVRTIEVAPPPDRMAARDRARDVLERARASLRLGFRSPSGIREEADARDESADERDAPAPPERPEQRLARAVGVLVHDALERWDFRDGRALRRLAREAALRAARRESLEPGPLESEAEAVVDALLASDLPAHLAGIEVIGRELPLLFRDADGTEWSGTIDLLYRDRDGRLVVADWKTDRRPDAATRERYRAQLASYARGVVLAFPDEPAPAGELVFVRAGRRERVLLESPA